jgi:hypothetical protein
MLKDREKGINPGLVFTTLKSNDDREHSHYSVDIDVEE